MTRTEDVVNGYFYRFVYESVYGTRVADPTPLIYCTGPSTKNINNFRGLNFHHLPLKQREELLQKMQISKQVLENGVRAIFTEEELNRMVPGCAIAIREYSRKRVFECNRLDNEEVPGAIYSDVARLNPVKRLLDWLLHSREEDK